MKQIDFDQKYKGRKPEEIIEAEVNASIAKLVEKRDKAEREELEVACAKFIINKFMPDKQKHEHSGVDGEPIEHKVRVEFI